MIYIRRITYLILIIASILFYILFIGKISLYTLVIVLALPAAMLLLVIIGKKGISADISTVSENVLRKEQALFCINIKNKTLIPFPKSIIELEYRNTLCSRYEKLFIDIPIYHRFSQQVRFTLIPDKCGILEVRLKRIKLLDHMRIFSMNININSTADIAVIPDNFYEGNAFDIKFSSDEYSDVFSKTKSGDDPTEIFELKDYVPGDKLNRIHWNLSSRQSVLISKHYSLGVSPDTLVVPLFALDKSLSVSDTALELFYCISMLLLKNETAFRLLMEYQEKPVLITDESSFREAYAQIIRTAKSSGINSESVRRAAAESAKVFFLTDRSTDDIPLCEDIASAEQFCFAVGTESKTVTQIADNISIITVPAGGAASVFEGSLL